MSRLTQVQLNNDVHECWIYAKFCVGIVGIFISHHLTSVVSVPVRGVNGFCSWCQRNVQNTQI